MSSKATEGDSPWQGRGTRGGGEASAFVSPFWGRPSRVGASMNLDKTAQGERDRVSARGFEPLGAQGQGVPGSVHPWASKACQLCERLTEVILYVVVVFNPWVFGTTQRTAIWVMNGAGYLLGALLAAKLLVRWTMGCGPVAGSQSDRRKAFSGSSWPVSVMAVLTVLLLVYVLVGAVNARAAFNVRQLTFEYFRCIAWLPHSYDRTVTWFEFWEYLGLACTFWAARDWLRGTAARELPAEAIECSASAPAHGHLPHGGVGWARRHRAAIGRFR